MGTGMLGLAVTPPGGADRGDDAWTRYLYAVLKPADAARYLDVPEDALIAEAAAGRVPGQQVRGEWRFLRLALVDWLRAARTPEPVPPDFREWLRTFPKSDETPEEQEAFLAHLRTIRKSWGTVGGPDESAP